MKPARLPRRFAVLFLLLLAAVFLTGNVLAFGGLQAAQEGTPVPAAAGTGTVTLTPTPTRPVYPPSADTTGILILGILLVAIILIGLLWGGRMGRSK